MRSAFVCLCAEQPPVAVSTCELDVCTNPYKGEWQAQYDSCSSECGEVGKRLKWYKCSTGNEVDCDPNGQSQCTVTTLSPTHWRPQ